ncbi:glutamate synthase small subunit, putative [Babesia ovis]|uniref:Glutamate synthase small subunit, putative n=1 Tax=Babesia ovis TaxID=5869 RepID=A0A9W5WTU6_BABOV|nr:glutamate synthase small subunit, putative [Babesia ovis]
MKRGQVICSTEPGLWEKGYYDEPIRVSRKRHCHLRTSYGIPSPLRRDPPVLQPVYDTDADVCNLADSDNTTFPRPIRTLISEWSDKIIDGLRNVQNTRDLKEPLANYLAQFYTAICSANCDTASPCPEENRDQEGSKDQLVNRIGHLLQRNSVLCNVVRHQYDTIRRLQTSETLVSNLQKEKAALSDELSRLKECVNAYVGTVSNGVGPNYESLGLHFTRRPPDVC